MPSKSVPRKTRKGIYLVSSHALPHGVISKQGLEIEKFGKRGRTLLLLIN